MDISRKHTNNEAAGDIHSKRSQWELYTQKLIGKQLYPVTGYTAKETTKTHQQECFKHVLKVKIQKPKIKKRIFSFDSMEKEILTILIDIEKEHNVDVLYACESGSRAWGFASPDSDYDVRFIYKHRLEHYLQIDERKDVIELPVDSVLDINGWDIKKSLKLFRNSNSPLYEWLQSPVVYSQKDSFIATIHPLMREYYSLKAGLHHYASMTVNTLRDSLQDENVKLKKYFYTLRPLAAAMWICKRRELPPMEFNKLREVFENNVIQETIDKLLEQKSKADEKELIPRIDLLNSFVANELAHVNEMAAEIPATKSDTEKLNDLFRNIIGEL